jgi:hypothetical protein
MCVRFLSLRSCVAISLVECMVHPCPQAAALDAIRHAEKAVLEAIDTWHDHQRHEQLL